MNIRYLLKTLLFVLGFSLIHSITAFAQLYPLSENDWSNPEFIERYLGSYGIDTELSPEISPEESLILQDLTPFIEDDVENGIFFLEPKISGESSAALDYMLGQLYLENSQPEDAIEAYSLAIRKFPNFLRAYKNISIAYMQLENCEGAKPHLYKVLDLGKADGLTYGMLGYCHIEDENYSSAISAYEFARMIDPEKRNWKVGYVQAMMQARKYPDAIVALNEIVADYPDEASYLMIQANAFAAVDREEEAISNLELVDRLGGSNGQSLVLLGDLYMKNKVPQLALKSYIAALDVDGRPNFSRAARGIDYFAREERWQSAESFLNRLKTSYEDEMSDDDQIALLIIEAQIAQGKEQYSTAAPLLSTAVTRAPLNGKALLLMAQNNKFLGDYERAELYYDRASKIGEYAYESLTDNARMAVSFGRLERALSLLKDANTIRPSTMLDNNIRILQNAVNSGR